MSYAPLPVRLQHFCVEWPATEDSPGEAWSSLHSRPVYLLQENMRSPLSLASVDGIDVCLMGDPIHGEALRPELLAEQLADHREDDAFLRTINGEFSAIISDTNTNYVHLLSSRFGVPPLFYYAQSDRLLVSFSFRDLWDRLHSLGWLEIEYNAFYQLLMYKRLFGHRTHAKDARPMPTASVLTFNGQSTSLRRYWKPDFRAKTTSSLTACADELHASIMASVRRKSADGARPCLFLSGGMDARTFLGCLYQAGKAPLCVTVNHVENREARVARTLAQTVGVPHRFFAFEESHYARVYEAALDMVGGMQLPMFMFLGYEDKLRDAADVIFHGHGLDYFFQGMYLPAKTLNLFGRHLYWKRPVMPGTPIEEWFLDNVGYRIGDQALPGMIKPGEETRLREDLLGEVRAVAEQARELADSPLDILEYLTFYNMARHYSFGDHWGMHTNLPQRTLSFDNDLYDLYRRLPARYRFDARILRTCLQRHHPDLARIVSANTTFPIIASSFERMLRLMGRSMQYKLGLKRRPAPGADKFERMGLPLPHVLAGELRPRVEALLRSDRLEQVPWVNMDAVRAYIRDFLENPVIQGKNGQLLIALLSIDRLLSVLDGNGE